MDFEIATNQKYNPNWHHELIANELEHIEKFGDRDYKILVVTVPPRHGKSQMCSIDFPSWYLGRNPTKEIITASYSGELAQDFGTKAREKVGNQEFRLIFPDVSLKADEQSRAKWRTNKGGSFISVGVGGAITGRGADCFPKGTLIQTEYGLLPIESCKNGTRVLSFNHDKNICEWKRIIASRKLVKDEFREITSTSGNRVIASSEHPFFVFGRGYIEAKDLREGQGVGILENKEDGDIEMRPLPQPIQERMVRIHQESEDRTERLLLRKDLLGESSRYKKQQALSYNSSQIKKDTISSITAYAGEREVYDIEVEDNHNFFANGFLVHNCLLIDDPIKNREEADSETYREKVWNWFTSTAFTRLEPNGVCIIILTRWHMDDLAGRVLAHPELSKRTKVMRFPAIAEEDDDYRKSGEQLWKGRYDLRELEEIKSTIGPYDWHSLYQCTPILTEKQEFRPEWRRDITPKELAQKNTRGFLTIDTAMSKKAQADFTGFCDNSVDKEDFWHLRAWKQRLGAEELVDAIFALHTQRKYEKIGIEKTAYTEGLKSYLDQEQRKRGMFLPLVELKHSGTAKEVRIRGLIPRYAAGSVFHVQGECTALEEEQMQFPNGKWDDVIDATAYQLQLVTKSGGGGHVYKPRWLGFNKR